MTETNEIGNKWVGRVPISLGHGWFSKQLSCGGSGFLPAGARAEAHIEDNNWSIPATALSSIDRDQSPSKPVCKTLALSDRTMGAPDTNAVDLQVPNANKCVQCHYV